MAEQMQGTEQTERVHPDRIMGGDVAPPLPKSMMPGGERDPGDIRGELGTKLVRRRLMTTDVWHLIRILGRISKDARERVLASEGNAGQVDVLGLFLTEGVDKAQAEINGWFADLTGIPARQIDSQEIGFYMDVLEDLDTVGIDGFLGRFIPWYRKKFGGSGKNSSPSE